MHPRHLLTPLLLLLVTPGPAARTALSAPADGAWVAEGPPTARLQHTLVLDSAHDRLVLFGGWDGAYRNDTWVLELGGPAEWRPLVPAGAAPPGRAAHAAVYDPAGDRMVVFGGMDAAGPLGDTWALALGESPAWTALVPGGAAPAARFGHSAILDAVRDRIVVFGGDDGGASLLDECWALGLGASPAWSTIATSGPVPAGRGGHSAILDPPHQRMIVFGGQDGVTTLADARALDLASGHWSAFSPSGTPPAARTGHAAVYEAAGQRMIVLEGWDGAFTRADCWSVNLAGSPAWTPLAPAGAAPTARSAHAAALDAARGRVIVFGGDDGARRNDAYALALAPSPAWSALAAPHSPSARYREGVVLDPLGRFVVFGGYDGALPYPAALERLSPGDAAWSALAASGAPPAGRYGHTMVWDPLARRAIVFGGHDGASRLDDPRALSFEPAPAWTALAPAGAGPSPRQNHAAVRDARRDRMLVIGGFDGARLGDVWSLGFAGTTAWEPLAPAGVPPSARSNHSAIYDPVRDRVVVFGGSDGTFRNDLWELTLGATPEWRPLAATGTPPSPRVGHVAIYDPVRDRMVVFGGDDLAFRDDVWALSLSGTPAWTPLAPAGSPTPGRRFHAALYDPRRDALWVHGGWNGDYRGDAAELVWGAPARAVADGPGALAGPAGATIAATFTLRHDLGGPRAIEWTLAPERHWPGFPLHGLAVAGTAAHETLHVSLALPDSAAPGVQQLRLSVALAGAESFDSLTAHALTVVPRATSVADGEGAAFAIGALAPNPGRGPFAIAFRAPRAGLALLEWFDVGGRRVGAPATLALVAGAQVRRVEAPRGAAPGLHLVRARFGGATAMARVVVLR